MRHINLDIFEADILHHGALSIPHLNDAAAQMVAPRAQRKADGTVFKAHVAGVVIGLVNAPVSDRFIRPRRVVAEEHVVRKPLRRRGFRFKRVVPRADKAVFDDGVFAIGKHDAVRIYPVREKQAVFDGDALAVVETQRPGLGIDHRDSAERNVIHLSEDQPALIVIVSLGHLAAAAGGKIEQPPARHFDVLARARRHRRRRTAAFGRHHFDIRAAF